MTDIGATFRALHVLGTPFILANVWNGGSAKMLAAMGAKALATSSAAHAFTQGRHDGGTLTRDEALAHAQDIVAMTSLPVQGDFENGFGDAPETCADTVRLAAEVGLAGICIEDIALPSDDAYDFDLAVARIKAAASAAKALPADFVLTARADGILRGVYDCDEAIRRTQAFAAAGADCVYTPMPRSLDDLKRLVAAVDVPVNALVAGQFTGQTLADFAQMGAARLSLGSSLANITYRAIHDAGHEMFGTGRFDRLAQGINGAVIDDMLATR